MDKYSEIKVHVDTPSRKSLIVKVNQLELEKAILEARIKELETWKRLAITVLEPLANSQYPDNREMRLARALFEESKIDEEKETK